MRAVPASACLSVVCFAAFAACSDDPRIEPLAVSWLEWSDSVTAGPPFGVRVYGLIDSPPGLRIRVRVDGDTVTIAAQGIGVVTGTIRG